MKKSIIFIIITLLIPIIIFARGQISLLDPFGGVYFQRGSDTQIRWEASFEGMIDIYFSADGGNNWDPIRSDVEASLGVIDWQVPNITSSNCKIKISSGSDAGRETTSYNFTIGNEQALSGILVDEKYEDWDILPDIAQVKPGVESDRASKAFNDENFLYIYFETGEFLSLQNDNSLTLYIDSDNNTSTGKPVNGIGAEIEFRFGERAGTTYVGDKKNAIGVGDLFLIISPTIWSDRFEITMNLNSSVEDKKIFAGQRIRILIKDESTGVSIPAENGGAGYQLGKYSSALLESYTMIKNSDDYIRILAHNVLFSSFFRDDRKESYARMYQAIQPDIIGFSELYQDYKLEDVTMRLEEILPSPDGKSWKAQRTSDNVLATKYTIKYNTSAGPFGNGAFLLDLRPKFNSDLLVIVAHPPCCDNDPARQNEADAMAAFIRDAKAPGGELTLVDKTPVIIVGDMNFVGDPRQVTALVDGDIVQEDTYGGDFTPDWDGTSFVDAMPRTSNLPHSFTHTGSGAPGTYSNGRLDYIFYSGSVLNLENSFVMFTPAMPQDTLTMYGILQNDSDNASDHLPLIGDFSLSFEQEESSIYSLRQNDKHGVPVKIDQVADVSGIITASKEFGNDGNSFIQDNQAAIAIHGSDFITQLITGDSITLTGTVTQNSGLTRLTFDPGSSNLTVHKKVNLPNPRIVTIAEVREQDWDGKEMLESRLIKIEDIKILSAGNFAGDTNYKMSDGRDTMDVRIDSNTDLVGTTIPDKQVSLTGFLGQSKASAPYDEGYQLLPGSLKDIYVIPEIRHVPIITLHQNNSEGISKYVDSVMSVSGVVTVTTQFGDRGPAFLQDSEAGIAVYGASFISKMKMGDSVTVTGPLVSYNGLTEYIFDAEVSDVTVHKNIAVPDPQLITISDIINQERDGVEELEAKLVMIKNIEFTDNGKFEAFRNYQFTDGLDSMNIRVSNQEIFNGASIPTGKVTLIGIVGQSRSSAPYRGGYQLLPRSADDIKIKSD